MSRNDDPVGDQELLRHLQHPDARARGVAAAILDGIGPDTPAPVTITALTLAMAEALLANTSPPTRWARAVGKRIEEIVRQGDGK